MKDLCRRKTHISICATTRTNRHLRSSRLCAPFVYASWGSQTATLAEKTVTADGDGGIASRCAGAGARGRLRGSIKVTPDHGFCLDDRLASEHDVLGADQDRLPGHLVACVLPIIS